MVDGADDLVFGIREVLRAARAAAMRHEVGLGGAARVVQRLAHHGQHGRSRLRRHRRVLADRGARFGEDGICGFEVERRLFGAKFSFGDRHRVPS